MTEKKTTVTPIGPSQVLVSCIAHLQNLLQNLLEQLPLNPPNSTYDFFLDEESLAEHGPFGALSHILEVCFRTYQNPQIHFSERGRRLDDLISTIKAAVKTMSDSDQEAFCHAWLEGLIDTALLNRAKISKKRKESDTTTLTAPAPSTSSPCVTSIEKQQGKVIEIDSDSESPPAPKCLWQSTKNDNISLPVVIINETSDLASKTKPPLKQTSLNGVWKKRSKYTEEALAQAQEVSQVKEEEQMHKAVESEQRRKQKKEEKG
ncbi:unnamed protein product [Cyclocybe aegerita]|uniref:Uncharacterized protein n=1 Tax=Cyclocybe aegerita TaxID=1973307 RepID=A0A8S0WWQ8_CYCAE|nr:unnamed protein product [Cyclocybe aegerita]